MKTSIAVVTTMICGRRAMGADSASSADVGLGSTGGCVASQEQRACHPQPAESRALSVPHHPAIMPTAGCDVAECTRTTALALVASAPSALLPASRNEDAMQVARVPFSSNDRELCGSS